VLGDGDAEDRATPLPNPTDQTPSPSPKHAQLAAAACLWARLGLLRRSHRCGRTERAIQFQTGQLAGREAWES
jgi:hypothetical protein